MASGAFGLPGSLDLHAEDLSKIGDGIKIQGAYTHMPFRKRAAVEKYIETEISSSLPDGWTARRSTHERSVWFIKKDLPGPGEWGVQEYGVRACPELGSVIFTYGNSDHGAGVDLSQSLQPARIISLENLERHGLEKCFAFLLENCKPNEWGYT